MPLPAVTRNFALCDLTFAQCHCCCIPSSECCVCRLANQQSSAVLICWRQQVHWHQRTDRLVAQRIQHTKSGLLVAMMSQWRQLAAIQQGKAAIIAKCQRKHATHLLQQGLLAFSTALEVRKAKRNMIEVVSSRAKVSQATRKLFVGAQRLL